MGETRNMFYSASSAIFKNAKKLRANQTLAEKLLWEELRANKLLGLRFKRQHPIGTFVADFYSHPVRLVIEIDGGYHDLDEHMEYDAGRTEEIEQFGVKVIRFTNAEVEGNIKSVIEQIKTICTERQLR
ncbi:MAG: endonuclease domain-containing protein [Imperialibacter sp.]|uniref:endonuclease domain-containing protein n=1 Tax=Imperialibacter sp. TaxID=2038411 RepID=UPI003A847AFF